MPLHGGRDCLPTPPLMLNICQWESSLVGTPCHYLTPFAEQHTAQGGILWRFPLFREWHASSPTGANRTPLLQLCRGRPGLICPTRSSELIPCPSSPTLSPTAQLWIAIFHTISATTPHSTRPRVISICTPKRPGVLECAPHRMPLQKGLEMHI